MCLGLGSGGQASAVSAAVSEPTPVDVLMNEEAEVVQRVEDMTLRRDSSTSMSGKTTNYEITASAYGTEGFAYYKHWACSKSWWTPRGCSNFGARRTEFFAAALAKHREVRAELLSAFDVSYLAHKNELDPYLGLPFRLVNNVTTQQGALGPSAASTCLGVEGIAVGLFGCDFDRATTGQAWRFVPGTGLVKNTSSGLCLDVTGDPAAQIDGLSVVMAECDATGDPLRADHQWGMHPLGYLVNLANGRCLDMGGAPSTSNGTGARVATCEYGLSPGPNSLASSEGIRAVDPATEQSWSMSYIRGGTDRFLPAPVPPRTTIDSGPRGEVDSRTPSPPFTFSSRIPGSTFECSRGGRTFSPCVSPVENPLNMQPGQHLFTVRSISPDGVVDPRGATRVWTVVRKGPA